MSKGKGFLLNFANEKDINIFFTNEIFSKCQENNLYPQFAHETILHREVIIPNIPHTSYLKDNEVILTHLNEVNNLNIIHLIKFTSRSTQKKFIRIFLDCKESQSSVINKSTIKLDNIILPAEPVKNRRYHPSSHLPGRNPHYQHQQQ